MDNFSVYLNDVARGYFPGTAPPEPTETTDNLHELGFCREKLKLWQHRQQSTAAWYGQAKKAFKRHKMLWVSRFTKNSLIK